MLLVRPDLPHSQHDNKSQAGRVTTPPRAHSTCLASTQPVTFFSSFVLSYLLTFVFFVINPLPLCDLGISLINKPQSTL